MNLGRFYCELIDRLLLIIPEFTVVIDGHNSNPAKPTGVAFRSTIGKSALDLEQEIVKQIRSFATDRPVTVVDCVGAYMPINLFWINRSSFFVAPWGAGLAKYRWICNKPGFVFSSRLNLRRSHGLGIYHWNFCMEDPAPMEFVNADHVIDLPVSPSEMAEISRGETTEPLQGHNSVCFELVTGNVLDRIVEVFRQWTEGGMEDKGRRLFTDRTAHAPSRRA